MLVFDALAKKGAQGDRGEPILAERIGGRTGRRATKDRHARLSQILVDFTQYGGFTDASRAPEADYLVAGGQDRFGRFPLLGAQTGR